MNSNMTKTMYGYKELPSYEILVMTNELVADITMSYELLADKISS